MLYCTAFTTEVPTWRVRVIGYQSEKRLIHAKKKQTPIHIKVFGVITSDGGAMSLFIFLRNLRLNTGVYVLWVEVVVLSWIDTVADRKPIVWQQNSASCNTNRITQSWQSKNLYDHIILNI